MAGQKVGRIRTKRTQKERGILPEISIYNPKNINLTAMGADPIAVRLNWYDLPLPDGNDSQQFTNRQYPALGKS